MTLTLTTYDWVPDWPRGYVRDLRIRWALEEAGLPYTIATTPFHDRGPAHFAHQPFGQVPWLTDGDLTIFESGAILLHLAEKSPTLMPPDPRSRAEVTTWLFAALNSMELATVPWSIFKFMNQPPENPIVGFFEKWLASRLQNLETVLEKTEWLTGPFTIADIAMSDVLRLMDRMEELTPYPAARAYVTRATARPAFRKAHADQMAHFAAAD
ncbi:glutathione S-transferase family protein [Tabrizicola sp. BL-A-41-H6]|uniref:glutathione S-transferase family protein n=1 Tax=Tabrizicola sp. BL-A-41-H6 TaxID=3421107 RepID=UPI003D672D2D